MGPLAGEPWPLIANHSDGRPASAHRRRLEPVEMGPLSRSSPVSGVAPLAGPDLTNLHLLDQMQPPLDWATIGRVCVALPQTRRSRASNQASSAKTAQLHPARASQSAVTGRTDGASNCSVMHLLNGIYHLPARAPSRNHLQRPNENLFDWLQPSRGAIRATCPEPDAGAARCWP